MAQWEYCRLLFVAEPVNDEGLQAIRERGLDQHITEEVLLRGDHATVLRIGSLRFLSEPRESARTVTDFGDTVTELGRDGWEAVGYAIIGGTTDVLFKRPLEEVKERPKLARPQIG